MTLGRQAAEDFLIDEAQLLDDGRYEEWLALFTENATYWIPSEAGQESPVTTVSLVYDDRRLIETRVRRLLAGRGHALDPGARTTRLIANLKVTATGDPSETTVRSKFVFTEYRRERQRIFSGTYTHVLRETPHGLRIRSKRIDLVNCDATLDGLSLPF